MDDDLLTITLRDIRAELIALRFFTTGLYANVLSGDATPLATAKRLAREEVLGLEGAYEFGPVDDDLHEVIQRSLHHLEGLWNHVEAVLQRRNCP